MTTTTDERNRTLFELTADLVELFDALDMAEDDTEAEKLIEAALTEDMPKFQDKADGYAHLIREFEKRAEARKAEAERHAQAARSLAGNAYRLKTAVMSALQMMGMKRLDTDVNSFRVCGNGGKTPLDIHDPNLIPGDFTYTVQELDKDKIRRALETGEDVPGAILMERGKHLRIK